MANPFGKLEGVETLCKVLCEGVQTGDHDCARVSPQRVLQQPGYLGVPVGNVVGGLLPPVPEGTYDVPQSQQARVDVH